jgi:hypothetical protein
MITSELTFELDIASYGLTFSFAFIYIVSGI